MSLSPVAPHAWQPAGRTDAHFRAGFAPTLALTTAAILISTFVLIVGWIAGVDFAQRGASTFTAMVPSTAICVILLSGGLLAIERGHAASRRAGAAAGIFAIAIGLSNMAIRALSEHSGIDQILLPETIGDDGTAFATSVITILAGYILLFLSRSDVGDPHIFEVSATCGLTITAVALTSYLFDADGLYRMFIFTSLSVHTALAYAFLFAAFLFTRAEFSWVRHMTGRGTGSESARRLFPIVVIGPVVFGYAALTLTQANLVSEGVAYATITVAIVVLAVHGLVRNAAIVNASELRMQQQIAALVAANEDKRVLLGEVFHRVKNNLQHIASMLQVELHCMEEEGCRKPLRAMMDHVNAMGFVHHLLVDTPSPGRTRTRAFMHSLVGELAVTGGSQNVALSLECDDDDPLSLDVALPLGLLVNELVREAGRRASEGAAPRQVHVRLSRDTVQTSLRIWDDAAGGAAPEPAPGHAGSTNPPEQDRASTRILIAALVRQLGGTMTVETDVGTTVRVDFRPESAR